MEKLRLRTQLAWDLSFPTGAKKREVGFTIDIQGTFSPFTKAPKITWKQWWHGLGGTLGTARPEPLGTIWGFHTHPFGRDPYPSRDDKDTSRLYNRPESMIGETQIGTFNPHAASNGEPALRLLAR